MNRLLWIAIGCLVAALLGVTQATAMGADHPRERLVSHGSTCVHGYWINSSDVFFHAGDTVAFNRFIGELAKNHATGLRVVLHPGVTQARSPWATSDRNVGAEWSVTTGPMAWGMRTKGEVERIQIDLWVGGRVRMEGVKLPSNVEIVRDGTARKGMSDPDLGNK